MGSRMLGVMGSVDMEESKSCFRSLKIFLFLQGLQGMVRSLWVPGCSQTADRQRWCCCPKPAERSVTVVLLLEGVEPLQGASQWGLPWLVLGGSQGQSSLLWPGSQIYCLYCQNSHNPFQQLTIIRWWLFHLLSPPKGNLVLGLQYLRAMNSLLKKQQADFSDEHLQKQQLRLPKIDQSRNNTKQSDKFSTTYNELPKIEKSQDGGYNSQQQSQEVNSMDEIKYGRSENVGDGQQQEKYDGDFEPEAAHSEKEQMQERIIERLLTLDQAEGNKASEEQNANAEQMQTNVDRNDESDLSDFQQKVQLNKELIRKQVFKKKGQKKQTNKKPQKKRRNQSLYEKRVKQYRDNSENKYLLQKKKQMAIHQLREKLREQRQLNLKKVIRGQTPKQHSKRVGAVRSMSKGMIDLKPAPQQHALTKDLLKPTAIRNQDANFQLFQDIHSILKNPQNSRSDFLSKIARTASLKPKIDQLSDRIRQLQNAPSSNAPSNPSQPLKLEIPRIKRLGQFSLLDWRRHSVNPQRIVESVQSNFHNEVQRIGSFVGRNEQSIDSFVRNREQLIELELQNRLREMRAGKVEAV